MRGSCTQPEDARRLLGVLGVFSHTTNLMNRHTIRDTWLTLAQESLVTKFVMRSQGDDRVAQEAAKHGDVVMLDAPAAMSKDVGPLWSSMLWLACAPRAWPGADMIGHAEDDIFAHLPGIVSYLRHTASIPRDPEAGADRPCLSHNPSPSSNPKPNPNHTGVRLYWGTFELFHWNEHLHLPEKHWNRYSAETLVSQPCRRRTIEHLRHHKKERQFPGVYTNHTVVGPFAFAKGPLYFLSAALAREVAAHRAVGREARAVIERGDDAPSGYVGMTACDDAFIGYTVAQLADSGEPLHYVSMPSDAYAGKSRVGLQLAAPAVAVHLHKKHAKSKSWRFIRVAHQWKLRGNHCERPLKLQHTRRLAGVVCGGARWQDWFYNDSAEPSEPCSNQAVQLVRSWDERHADGSCAHAALHAPMGVLPEGVSHGNGACGAARRMTKAYGQWPRPGTRSPHASPCAAAASAAAISLTRRRAGTALGLRRAGWAGWCSQQSTAPLSWGKRTPPWRSLLSYLSLELESRERETLKRSDSTLKYLVFYNGFFEKNKTKSALPTRATD